MLTDHSEMAVLLAFVCWFTWFWFDVVGVGCVDFSFVAAALWLWWWPSFLAFPAGFWWVWLGSVGVLFVNSIVCLFFVFEYFFGWDCLPLWWVFRAYCFYSFVRIV